MRTQGPLWVDIEGVALTSEDHDILAHPAISGLILFSRNFQSLDQLRTLTNDIRKHFPHLVITVDQEGGRVQRFREGFTALPAMQYWGDCFQQNAKQASYDFSRMLEIMIQELKSVGVYSSLVPVLDIDYKRSDIIGHRSFGDGDAVIRVAEFMIDQCHRLQMPVTGKHFPGHGYVIADSHLELPVDERPLTDIVAQDIAPYQKLSQKLEAIMLAHVVYAAVDPNPVCFSSFWIQDILRNQLKYDGIVMSDDLSMQAVAKMGSYADRAAWALEAGCDVLLVCNNREGVIDILDHAAIPQNALRAKRLAYYGRYLATPVLAP